MTGKVYRVLLPGAAFGDGVSCLGSQLSRILETVRTLGPSAYWFYCDVGITGRSRLSTEPGLHAAGDIDALMSAIAEVDQFERGVFFGAATASPQLRNDPGTDDEPFANLGEAEIELRAFDTTAFEVYCRHVDVARALGGLFDADVEARG